MNLNYDYYPHHAFTCECGAMDPECELCEGDPYFEQEAIQAALLRAVDGAFDDLADCGWQVLKGNICCRNCAFREADAEHLPFIGYCVQTADNSYLGDMWLFHSLGWPRAPWTEAELVAAFSAHGLRMEWDGSDERTIRVLPPTSELKS